MSGVIEIASERLLRRAYPHLWGPGRVHLLVGLRTVCGRNLDNCPGEQVRGPLEDVTCRLCLRATGIVVKAADAEEIPVAAEPFLPPLPAMEGEQLAALAAAENFLTGDRQCFLLHGLAGTGKTTVLALLARRHRDAALLAPTGKAAAVLTRKTGLPAMTLHKLLYQPEIDAQGNLIGFQSRFAPGQLTGRIADR